MPGGVQFQVIETYLNILGRTNVNMPQLKFAGFSFSQSDSFNEIFS